jgi:hypothetical protein
MKKHLIIAITLTLMAASWTKAMEEDADLAAAIAASLQEEKQREQKAEEEYNKAIAESAELEPIEPAQQKEKELGQVFLKSDLAHQEKELRTELAEKLGFTEKFGHLLNKFQNLWSEYPKEYSAELEALPARQKQTCYSPQETREIYRLLINRDHAPCNIAGLIDKALEHNDTTLIELLAKRGILG